MLDSVNNERLLSVMEYLEGTLVKNLIFIPL